MNTDIAPTKWTNPSTSRFTRNRPGWVLLGLATIFMPLLWPVGIYILWKVYDTRTSGESHLAAPIVGDGWQ